MTMYPDEKSAPVIQLWHEAVKGAEDRCQISLPVDIESYLISLLIRFTQQSDLLHQVMAAEYLHALQEKAMSRRYALAAVGDQCLILSGLFPGVATRRQLNVRYFVELGRASYATVSGKATDIYTNLARQFVLLMDVLQAVNERHILMPIEAYDLWNDLGSQRAYNVLQGYRTKQY